MTKISKNIKQLRMEKGMTQEELAEKLFVTRQAVSSWENGRTQPDIYMLGKLRVIFDVSIEELLYGKKRNTELELKKPDYKKTLMLVFSVLGGFLCALGVVLLIAFAWEIVPEFLRKSISVVPFVLGVGVAIYVYKNKRSSAVWCEGGAIAAVIGMVSGFYMTVDIFEVKFLAESPISYLICSVCVATVMLLLKAVSCMPAFYVLSVLWVISFGEGVFFTEYGSIKMVGYNLAVLAIFGVGVYFSHLIKKDERTKSRHTASEWITAIMMPLLMSFVLLTESYDFGGMYVFIFTVGLAYYIAFCRDDSPYKTVGFIVMAVSAAFGALPNLLTNLDLGLASETRLLEVIQLLMLAAALVKIRFKFKSVLQLVMSVYYLVYVVSLQVAMNFYDILHSIDRGPLERDEVWHSVMEKTNIAEAVATVVSVIFFALMIAYGASEKKLSVMNVGFIGFSVVVILWLFTNEIGLFWNGLTMLLFGGGFLSMNLYMTRRLSAEGSNKIVVDNDGK